MDGFSFNSTAQSPITPKHLLNVALKLLRNAKTQTRWVLPLVYQRQGGQAEVFVHTCDSELPNNTPESEVD